MIDYYTAKSLGGNTRKVSIMLAETALEHVIFFVDLDKGEQHEAWYRALNANGKIPAIVDHGCPGALRLAESGAILVYLAEKTGRFLPSSGAARARVFEWLFWQASSLGPMAGQWNYFQRVAPERVPFAIARYRDECARLLAVLNDQLGAHEYVAGDYSIADMMIYSWAVPVYRGLRQAGALAADQEHADFERWIALVQSRPAVGLAMSRYEGSALRVGRDVEAPLR
jgi:GST-like protein